MTHRLSLPAAIWVAALLNDKHSDRQFRQLIRDLPDCDGELKQARDYLAPRCARVRKRWSRVQGLLP